MNGCLSDGLLSLKTDAHIETHTYAHHTMVLTESTKVLALTTLVVRVAQ